MSGCLDSGQAVIEGDYIVIRVLIPALPLIVEGAEVIVEGRSTSDVYAPAVFARDLVRELNREEEDGTTCVHKMFDGAILEAIEQGAEGVVDKPSEDSESECHSCGEEMPTNECPKSERPCGHHCNHSWSHDECTWCGATFGEDAGSDSG